MRRRTDRCCGKAFSCRTGWTSSVRRSTDTFGRFTAQPFERGFGTTIGNALRRVLLSSIEGAADHRGQDRRRAARVLAHPGRGRGRDRHHPQPEADSAQAARRRAEDGVRSRVDKAGEVHGRRHPGRRRRRDPRARMPTSPPSPRTATSTWSCGSRSGRGYVSADKNFDEDLGIGWIPVDSVHSPVNKVNYIVEAARVGQATDYDKLTLEVWTNGAISRPTRCRSRPSYPATTSASSSTPRKPTRRGRRRPIAEATRRASEHLDKSVEELELSVRSYNCLQERQHPHDPRAGAEDRDRDAEDQELRPQVAQRNQGHPGDDGSEPRHEARSARGPGAE